MVKLLVSQAANLTRYVLDDTAPKNGTNRRFQFVFHDAQAVEGRWSNSATLFISLKVDLCLELMGRLNAQCVDRAITDRVFPARLFYCLPDQTKIYVAIEISYDVFEADARF